MKKNSILLIELFIGIVLISLCALPILQLPLSKYGKGIETLAELEMSRINELSWKEILLSLPQTYQWNEKPKAIPLPDTYSFKRSYIIKGKRNKKGSDGADYRLLQCNITFTSAKKKETSFEHYILVKKTNEIE